MSFKPNDVIWVPSSIAPIGDIQEKCEYWPARFVKPTNRPDICMVSLFSGKKDENRTQQYLVDTQLIINFEDYRVTNPGSYLLYAYECALKEFNSRIKQPETIKHQVISNSSEFCQYIHQCLSIEMMYNVNESKIDNKQKKIAPKFSSKQGLPVQKADLQLYFVERIPEIIGFLIQSQSPKSLNFLSFLKQSKDKIISQIIKALKNHQLRLVK